MEKKVTVIGAAVVDMMAAPVDDSLFEKGSVPARHMEMTCGGDALNEAVVLSNLGISCELVSLLGEDELGGIVLNYLKKNGVSTEKISRYKDLATAQNIVLVDSKAERYFITDPKSSLRKLSKEHILPYTDGMGDIVSFGSIFVSHDLQINDMAEVFREIKKKPGRILVADMTTAKNGEKIEELKPFLFYLDYLIPNKNEAELLTGESDPKRSARVFVENGVKNIIIKCGKDGCVYANKLEDGRVSAYPVNAVDTTGAGDSFVSGFIYGLSKGFDIKNSCRYGCAVASVVVEHLGAHGDKLDCDEVEKRFGLID